MLTLGDLVSVFERKRSIIPSLISKGILQTSLQPSEYDLLSLTDNELINTLKTPLLLFLLKTNNIHKVTRLTVIYDSLDHLQEAEEYILSQPKSTLFFLASLPVPSLMVNLAKEVQTRLPSELWREVIGKLESKRDISAFTSTRKIMRSEKEEYIANHQYSVLKGNAGETQYYNNYLLTKFKVEMLDMMYGSYIKSIEEGKYMNNKYNIPDYDNQLVISIIFAIELAKYYNQFNTVINMPSIEGVKLLLEDIIPAKDYVIEDNIIMITIESIIGNLIRIFITNSITVKAKSANTLIMYVGKKIPYIHKLTHYINISFEKSNLKSYSEAEVTPVWVKINRTNYNQNIYKGRTLILRDSTYLYPSKEKLESVDDIYMSLFGTSSGVVWNLLKHFDNILVIADYEKYESEIQEIYSILSQHSTYPRNLIITHDKDVSKEYIPFPTKFINEMRQDGMHKDLSLNVNRPSYYGLTYVEMLAVTFHSLKYEEVNTRPETGTVYHWIDSKIANRVVSYTLPVARRGTQLSFNHGEWVLHRTDKSFKEDC